MFFYLGLAADLFGMSGLDSASRMPCSPVQGSHTNAHLKERDMVSYQLHTDAKVRAQTLACIKKVLLWQNTSKEACLSFKVQNLEH